MSRRGVLGTRPNISESHGEISTRVPFCIEGGRAGARLDEAEGQLEAVVEAAQLLDHHHLRYSSHAARSGLGLARVVRRFVWPRHVKPAC